MTPYEQARAVYLKEPCTRTFDEDLSLHLEFGFVFNTPEFFIMGRPICRSAMCGLILDPSYQFKREECDAWHIYLAAGNLSKAWDILPWPLGWLSFERKNVLRFHPTERIRRLCVTALPENEIPV